MPASGVTEIRVAGGTHRPDEDEGGAVVDNDRDATFQLLDGVALRGGYRGLAGGGLPDDRDIAAFPSILSGDIDGNDTGGAEDPTHDLNSRHVVTGTGNDATAILDGFTLTAGHGEFPGFGIPFMFFISVKNLVESGLFRPARIIHGIFQIKPGNAFYYASLTACGFFQPVSFFIQS